MCFLVVLDIPYKVGYFCDESIELSWKADQVFLVSFSVHPTDGNPLGTST